MTAGLVAAYDGFDLVMAGTRLVRHRPASPCLSVGVGTARVAMFRGNFEIEDQIEERIPLRHATVAGGRITFRAEAGGPPVLTIVCAGTELRFLEARPGLNRLRLHAEPDEHVWGGGEQMSYLDLRGRRFPLWTSEPGVGRDKSTSGHDPPLNAPGALPARRRRRGGDGRLAGPAPVVPAFSSTMRDAPRSRAPDLYGPDLLVAPVLQPGARARTAYFPAGCG